MTIARGMMPKMAVRQRALNRINGSKNTAAHTKRNNVRENGLTKRERCSAAIKEPATSTVATKTIKCACREGFKCNAG